MIKLDKHEQHLLIECLNCGIVHLREDIKEYGGYVADHARVKCRGLRALAEKFELEGIIPKISLEDNP